MALIYDQAELVAANWTIDRILKTYQAKSSPLWSVSDHVVYDPQNAAKPWYISGTTTGVAAQNLETPVAIVYGLYSNSIGIGAGRISIKYDVELIEPISPVANI